MHPAPRIHGFPIPRLLLRHLVAATLTTLVPIGITASGTEGNTVLQPATPGVARLETVGGVPTLVLDGQPFGAMMISRCRASFEQLAEFSKNNFQLYQEQVPLIGQDGSSARALQTAEERITRILKFAPDAYILLRFNTNAPASFLEEHPGELIQFDDGRADHFLGRLPIAGRAPIPTRYPSLASSVWREQTAAAIHRLVRHVETRPYASRIIGYMIGGGATGEWNYWGPQKFDSPDIDIDYSPPMLAAFRRLLRDKYTNEATLRLAWADPRVMLDTAPPPPPPPAERRRMDSGMFYNPRTQRRVMDYYEAYNRAMTDSLLLFARTAKNASAGGRLVGGFNGYLLTTLYLASGHTFGDELIRSPDIDFLAGPPQYKYCGPGDATLDRFTTESMKRHGKLWFREADTKTSFADPWTGSHPRIAPPDLFQTLGMLKREFSEVLCHGNNGWWYPIEPTYFNHPPILDLFARMQTTGRAALRFPRDSDADIAVVADFQSLLYSAPAHSAAISDPAAGPFPALLEGFRVQEISRIGAPVDFIGLDDLLADPSPRYKFVILLNTFALDNARRHLIDTRLRRPGRTLLWMFASGIFNPDPDTNKNPETAGDPKLDTRHMNKLLGHAVEIADGRPFPYELRLSEQGRSAFPSWAPGQKFGHVRRPEIRVDSKARSVSRFTHPVPAYPMRLAAAASTPAIEVLARFPDGAAGLVRTRRQATGAAEYWSGVLVLPAEMLRDMAREAGCHLFTDTSEIVSASRSFLSCHVAVAGERTFRLRRKSDVVDAITGELVARQALTFTASIAAFDTKLYFLGDAAEWHQAAADASNWFQARPKN
ncbi:hypothetical protein Ga0100230_012295 [Opitutaceae bacterium TAV3]|nr:hypothetical protein Ga0100230_012295 [Opitutaceae bacterium TAV3]